MTESLTSRQHVASG